MVKISFIPSFPPEGAASVKRVQDKQLQPFKVESEKRKPESVPAERQHQSNCSSCQVPMLKLKPPLSPKSSSHSLRRRHSSADSDDSINISIAETISDHSDNDIIVAMLQVKHLKRYFWSLC